MKACSFSQELLSAHLDGQAGLRSREVEQHLEACSECRRAFESWRESGAELARVVDAAVGDVDPLVALTRIRARIAAAETGAPLVRLALWWRDLWAFRRRAMVGLVAAAALGALSAPLVVLWAGRHVGGGSQAGATFAGVIVESLEWGGRTQPVIYQSDGGSTTVIWMEGDGTNADTNLGSPEP